LRENPFEDTLIPSISAEVVKMITRDQLRDELDEVQEKDLDILHRIIMGLASSSRASTEFGGHSTHFLRVLHAALGLSEYLILDSPRRTTMVKCPIRGPGRAARLPQKRRRIMKVTPEKVDYVALLGRLVLPIILGTPYLFRRQTGLAEGFIERRAQLRAFISTTSTKSLSEPPT
jgi:hypothetical protein